jgi:cytochrome c-type biogenesis protein CcmH
MISLWVAAALLSAGTASLILFRAARATAAAASAGEDPGLAIYRRQLTEIDDLAERDLIPADDRRSARAEAARRLLSAAERAAPLPLSASTGRGLVIATAAGAPLMAVAIYLATGSPQTPDQPFAGRAETWWRAVQAGQDLPPAQMAVVVERIVREHPGDPQPLLYLARAQLGAGDPFSAEASLRKAIKLAPGRADLWGGLGEALSAEVDGAPSADAHIAFQRAATLDPTALGPRYALARDQIVAGDVASGLASWRAIQSALPLDDPRRTSLGEDIAQVEKTGGLPAASAQPQAAATGGDPSAFIRAMVARLAARLAANPDDPAGWARLIRSYAVLGDAQRRTEALDHARQIFKGRPDALSMVESAAGAPQ